MSVVAAPADRRFRRVHVKPAKRRPSIGWLRPLVRYSVALLIVVAVGYRAMTAALHAHMLQVDRIVVHGNERLSNGEVLAILTGLRGESVLSADLDAWQRRLLASPWVEDASLRRSLPSTIDVLITERRAIGLGRLEGETYLVDDQGVLIDQFGPQYADLDLPLIDGLLTTATAGGAADAQRADLAARVVRALRANASVARRLSQIDVSDPHDAVVILNDDSAAIELGEDQFLPRLQSYLEVAAALHNQVSDIDRVDVRFDGRVYVQPAASRSRRGRPAEAPPPRHDMASPAAGHPAKGTSAPARRGKRSRR